VRVGDQVNCFGMSYRGIGIILRKVSENDPNEYYLVIGSGGRIHYVPLHALERIS
jgi:hypothetical protein